MTVFAALGEEIVNMYRDRDAFVTTLKASVRTLKDGCRQADGERKQAYGEQKREVAQMIRGFARESKARAQKVGTLLQEAAEMIQRFQAESAERAAGWRQVLASIPKRTFPSAGEPSGAESPFEGRRGRRRARE